MGSIATNEIAGNILSNEGWIEGKISFNDEGVITQIEGKNISAPNLDQPRLVPGFIDLHVHGGDGADAMEGEESVRKMCRFHLLNGTTTIAPTTMTAELDDIKHALAGVEKVRLDNKEDEAIVVGAHLEGPFLNENCLGAQPPKAIPYNKDAVAEFLKLAQINIATIAVEIQGGYDLLKHLTAANCKVQIGHSDATEEQVAKATNDGLAGYTHFFNAMTGLNHLNGGIVNYALAYADYVEVICDLIHVNESALKTTYKCVKNMYAITDSTSAAGREDGQYKLGENTIQKTGFVTRTLEGGLAGTATTMLQMYRNLLKIGFTEIQVKELVSSRAASYLGLNHGELKEKYLANILEIQNQEIKKVWLKGKLVSK